MEPETVTFIELGGSEARAVLAEYARSAARAGAACELLVSETQEELYLLVCRGALAPSESPPDSRSWSFRILEVFR